MQSGIAASRELHDAFSELVSSGKRGIVVGIQNEQLVPIESIESSTSNFLEDLSNLNSLLKDNEASYIILRRYDHATDAFVAVTYVPDTANVRQKMLFASTRLALTRELGAEKFRETIFATTKEELTAEGWKNHDKHSELKAPLTQEEETLQGVRAAEAETSRNTTDRKAHFTAGFSSPISDEALNALRALPSSSENLVQIKIDMSNEYVELAGTSNVTVDDLASSISNTEPRYSLFRYSHEHEGKQLSPIIFISSCPSGLKVKERMLYAASRAAFLHTASTKAELEVSKKLEVSDPSEISSAQVHEEFHPQTEQKSAFNRPKRPGRR